MTIRNAKITGTMLGREDHGIMTFMIFVEFYGAGCGIGGYAIDQYDRDTEGRVFSAKGLEAISKILETVGVDTWENLKGQYIRVKDNGLGSTVDEIGNFMEEKWFNIREFFENVSNERRTNMELAKITSKGQITIPIEIRKKLGVRDGDKVLFDIIEVDGPVVLTNSYGDAEGTVKNKNIPFGRVNYHTTDVKVNMIINKPYPMQNWLLNFYKRIIIG